MEKEIKKLLTALTALAFFVVFALFLWEDRKDLKTVLSHVSGDPIRFSAETGYYPESLSLTLTLDPEIPSSAAIYYTLNGEDPTVAGVPYSGSIPLEAAAGQTRIYPLKAALYYKGVFSTTLHRAYVIGGTGLSLPVVSITCPNSSLNDAETGIFSNPLSRGDAWVRDAHITMLDSSGAVTLDQAVGIEVSGGTSARLPVKSLTVLSTLNGENYDTQHDRLEFTLLSGGQASSSYSFVTRYNSVRFRAGSQDMSCGNVRSALISRLAEESSFDGCTKTQRCVVFLNGSFYGIFDMQQNYASSFLARRFGLPNGDSVEKWKGGEGACFAAAGVADYFDLDLDDPRNRAMLEQVVDMDNYLIYYAINILAGNTDWPDNNYEIWRSVGDFNPDNPYSDGRVRFLIYDTDLVYYTEENTGFFEGCHGDTFVSIMESAFRGTTSHFPKVMQSQYYRSKFLTIVSDLRNTAFSEANVQRIVDEEWAKIRGEYLAQTGQEYTDSMEAHIGLLKAAISRRQEDLDADFALYFQVREKYPVSFRNNGAVSLAWNQVELYRGESYENEYYCGTDFTVTATPYPGWEFDHWLVNGNPVYGNTLTISDDLAENGAVLVETVTHPLEGPQIIISEVSANRDNDWIRITNVGQESVDLWGWYLTDDTAEFHKYSLPQTLLQPNQSVIVYGKNSDYASGDCICNFNLKEYEVLYLTTGPDVADRITIPRMGAMETYGRYDDSAVLKFFFDPLGKRQAS